MTALVVSVTFFCDRSLTLTISRFCRVYPPQHLWIYHLLYLSHHRSLSLICSLRCHHHRRLCHLVGCRSLVPRGTEACRRHDDVMRSEGEGVDRHRQRGGGGEGVGVGGGGERAGEGQGGVGGSGDALRAQGGWGGRGGAGGGREEGDLRPGRRGVGRGGEGGGGGGGGRGLGQRGERCPSLRP